MTKWMSLALGLLAVRVVAMQYSITATETGPASGPVPRRNAVVRGGIDPSDLAALRTPHDLGDPLIEAEMDKDVYELGETPTLTVRLTRSNGQGVENATVAVDDEQHSWKGVHRGKGTYTVALDGTPGEHVLSVTADVVVDGASVHRGVAYSYGVATGHVQILDARPPRSDDTYLSVPLVLRVTANGYYEFQGTLVSKGMPVAYSKTGASLPAGATEMEMRFALVDLTVPGPYTLSNVMVQESGPSGRWVATAPAQVGKPFAVRIGGTVKPPPARILDPKVEAQQAADRAVILGPGPTAGPIP